MFTELRNAFFEYAPWSIVLPLFLTIKNFRRIPNNYRTWILVYLVLSLITQIAAMLLWKSSINNLPLLHLYTVLEFLVLLKFYAAIFEGLISKTVFICLALVFPLFALIDVVFFESLFAFNTLVRSIGALILIGFALYWFIKNIMLEHHIHASYFVGLNYINAVFFIYFSGSIVLFSFSNYINHIGRTLLMNIWSIHTLLIVFLYVAITFGIHKAKT
jgi:hypothetical protein